MSKTSIEWTEATWNPIVGCSITSPGCIHCYAMPMAARCAAMGLARYDGLTKQVNGQVVWTGKLARAPEATLLEPLRRKKPTTYFVNSMGDLFHEDCPDEWIDPVFAVMALCPQHTFQVLTKRSARMRDYLADPENRLFDRIADRGARMMEDGDNVHDMLLGISWPLQNVWLGVSTERQQEADERIPDLLATPAAVRFISAEPLLGAIDLKRWVPTGRWVTFQGAPVFYPQYFLTKCERCGWFGSSELCREVSYGDDADVVCPSCNEIFCCDEVGGRIDWVIVGGESGKDARSMHPDWARSLRDQCVAADVAFFFKQWGEWAPSTPDDAIGNPRSGWQAQAAYPHVAKAADLYPEAGAAFVEHKGKKAAGRLLDGVEHNAMPEEA